MIEAQDHAGLAEKAYEYLMEHSRHADDEAKRVWEERDRLLVAEAQIRTERSSA